MFGIWSLCGKTCVPVVSKEGAVLSMLARARLHFCWIHCCFPTLVTDKWVEVPNRKPHWARTGWECCSCHGCGTTQRLWVKNEKTQHSGTIKVYVAMETKFLLCVCDQKRLVSGRVLSPVLDSTTAADELQQTENIKGLRAPISVIYHIFSLTADFQKNAPSSMWHLQQGLLELIGRHSAWWERCRSWCAARKRRKSAESAES